MGRWRPDTTISSPRDGDMQRPRRGQGPRRALRIDVRAHRPEPHAKLPRVAANSGAGGLFKATMAFCATCVRGRPMAPRRALFPGASRDPPSIRACRRSMFCREARSTRPIATAFGEIPTAAIRTYRRLREYFTPVLLISSPVSSGSGDCGGTILGAVHRLTRGCPGRGGL